MTSFTGSQISQELLSAYIDGEVNSQEQQLIEHAVAADPEIAWQVESLRRTVALLADLPAIALPQSFVVPEARVADVVAARRAAKRQKTGQLTKSDGDWWQTLLDFLGGGNLLLRNGAAVAAVAFFVLMAGDVFTGAPALPTPQALSQPMPAAAPALAQVDTQPESVAMVESAEMSVTATEMPAAKAMPATSQEATQDTEQNAEPAAKPAAMSYAAEAAQPSPDAAPMNLGAEPGMGVGGGGDGLGSGGGGEITAPQPLQAAAPVEGSRQMSPPPAEGESASQESAVGAASLRSIEMPAAPAEAEPELAAEPTSESAPQAVAMLEMADAAADEPTIEPTAEPVEEIPAADALTEALADEPVPAEMASPVLKSAPTLQATDGPISPMRLAQIGLALVALLLSGLWIRSK